MIVGEGNGTPLQYSCLENPMDGGAWWATVHGVTTSRTRLSDFTFTFHFHALEEEIATHSRILAWRIPGMGEPGGLPSMGSHRVRHDWSDIAAAAASVILSISLFPVLNNRLWSEISPPFSSISYSSGWAQQLLPCSLKFWFPLILGTSVREKQSWQSQDLFWITLADDSSR